MRTVCFLLLLTAGIVVQKPAVAQGDPATDNEIYAGYCIGVIAAYPAVMEKINPNWRVYADPGAMPKVNQQIESSRRHFAGYLMSRGILTSPNREDALLGVMIAQKRGGAEALECGELGGACIRANQSPPMPDASRPLTPEAKKQYLDAFDRRNQRFDACVAQTAATPVCQSQRRCWEPDNLP